MTDRFSLSDESSIYRGNSEDGHLGSTDNIFHSEELPSGHSNPYIKGDRLLRGGEGGIDKFFSDPENADPELSILYKEFISENHLPMYHDRQTGKTLGVVPKDMTESDAKEAFAKWLNRESDHKEPTHARNKFGIDLRFMDFDEANPSYDNLVKLAKSQSWIDPQAKVVYKVNDIENPDQDVLIFENNGQEKIEVGVADFNEFIEVNNRGSKGIKMSRPDIDDEKPLALNVLHMVRLGNNTFKSMEMEVDYPQEKDIDMNAYEISILDRKSLENKFDEKIVGDIEDFWGIWTHGQSEIENIKFETAYKENKITAVTMYLKSGEKPIRIPSYVFRTAFKGITPFKDKIGNPIGFEFTSQLGKKDAINPFISNEHLMEIMSKLKIDGKELDKNVRVEIQKNQFNQNRNVRSIVDLVGASR